MVGRWRRVLRYLQTVDSDQTHEDTIIFLTSWSSTSLEAKLVSWEMFQVPEPVFLFSLCHSFQHEAGKSLAIATGYAILKRSLI
jgi:hypothetical protein